MADFQLTAAQEAEAQRIAALLSQKFPALSQRLCQFCISFPGVLDPGLTQLPRR